MRKIMQLMQTIPVILASLALAGCVGAPRDNLNSITDLGSNETIVVGKIELVPALQKNEQKVQGLTASNFENKVFILADEQNRELKNEPVMADFAGRIEADIGSNFFVRSNNRSFYFIGGMMYLKVGGRELSRVYFPGGLKVTINPGEKAVYIGTLQYHRDEFFNITKVALIDEFDKANAEFKKKYGNRPTLRKALLTAAK